MIVIRHQSSPKNFAQSTAHLFTVKLFFGTLSQYRVTVECSSLTNISQFLQVDTWEGPEGVCLIEISLYMPFQCKWVLNKSYFLPPNYLLASDWCQKNTQSEARMVVAIWNWSGKTLSPGALLAFLYFSLCLIFPPV